MIFYVVFVILAICYVVSNKRIDDSVRVGFCIVMAILSFLVVIL